MVSLSGIGWFLQNKGRCEWLVGTEAPPVTQRHDPDLQVAPTSTDIGTLLRSQPVDGVVCLEQVPGHTVLTRPGRPQGFERLCGSRNENYGKDLDSRTDGK
jgi:hypothetical protein